MFSIYLLIDFVERIRKIYSFILKLFFPVVPEDEIFDKVTIG